MLNVAVPVLVMVKTWDRLVPTTAFPKLREVELTPIPGAGTAFTVSVATALVAVPTVLLTTTVNCAPLSELVVAGVV